MAAICRSSAMAACLALLMTTAVYAAVVPMQCKSGGTATITYNSATKALSLGFNRSPGAYRDISIPAGTCAFLDRTISQSEPACITQMGVDAVYVEQLFPGAPVPVRMTSPQARWLEHFHLAAGASQVREWYFQVDPTQRAPVGNCFLVVSSGPGRLLRDSASGAN